LRVVNRWRRRLLQSLGMTVRWAVAVACALSLVLGGALAGSRYVFCSVMQQVRADACCHRPASPVSEIDVVECGCCKAHRLTALPHALAETRGSVPPSPLAVLSPSQLQVAPKGIARQRPWTARPRAGPPRTTDHTRLMVFLS
jgi:hypothetical protein